MSSDLDPKHLVKTPRVLKAERVRHRASFSLSKASPGETLYVAVPELDQGVVMVLGTMSLRFDLVVSGEANNYMVDNVSRALVNQMTLKFAGEVLHDTNRFDLYQILADFLLSKRQRPNQILESNQSTNLNKLRSRLFVVLKQKFLCSFSYVVSRSENEVAWLPSFYEAFPPKTAGQRFSLLLALDTVRLQTNTLFQRFECWVFCPVV